MNLTSKKAIKKSIQTPETVSGACMTGKIMSNDEVKSVSSYITQYKARKKASTTKK
jgi:hypothetical protein